MSAFTLVAVTCLVAVVQGCMTPDDLINTLHLSDNHYREAFSGLDVERDDMILMSDLEKHYWHGESAFARAKFIEMIDSPDKGEDIDLGELTTFMKKRSVKLAVYECKYINSRTLRKFCFADQILTYVYLVLDKVAINKFFASMESAKDKDYLICVEEVTAVAKEIVPSFTKVDIDNFLIEIGNDDKRITKDEFTEYVIQEDLHDDFRTCRLSLTGITATYDNKCLTKELMDYTKNSMTELDISSTFMLFDVNSDRFLKAHEIAQSTKCETDVATRFVTIMDDSKDGTVSYGEFRTYVKTHTVKLHLEHECSKKHESQEAEIKCYRDEILSFAKQNHKPIWLTVPDFDMLITFEDMDVSNDGKIAVKADLVDGLKWEQAIAEKFVTEMDRTYDDDSEVSLEEFNEYVDEPNMVYGMADCLSHPVGEDRVKCYVKELKEIMTHIMTKKEAEAFFKFYDKNDNKQLTKDEVKDKIPDEEKLKYFFEELAMGDDIITLYEFSWYVRQQEISVSLKKCSDDKTKHDALIKYLNDVMTEYDIVQTFISLDEDKDELLTRSDFNGGLIINLILKADKDDSEVVNFVEFWVYLNSPIGNTKKKELEESCTTKKDKQLDEINCYKEALLKPKAK